MDRAVLSEDITQIDAHAECHAAAIGKTGILDAQHFLQFNGTLDRIDGTCKLYQEAVAGGANDVPIELNKVGLDNPCPQLSQTVERTFFIRRHEPRIAGYVSGQNSRKPTSLPLQ
jgi:hypothetical protein